MIDIEKAKKTFEKYVNTYDMKDPDIIKKYNHSLRVCDLIDDIVSHSNIMHPDALELSQLIGLLHDIGRFEQDKQFNSYDDLKTFDHAGHGVRVLFDENRIREYIKETKYDDLIKAAVYNHNKFKLAEVLTDEEVLFTNILRDADKVDIMKIVTEDKKEVPATELVSQEIIDYIKRNELVPKTLMTNYSEEIMMVISFLFDINYKYSYYLIEQNKYLEKLLTKVKDPKAKALLPELKKDLIEKVGELYVAE